MLDRKVNLVSLVALVLKESLVYLVLEVILDYLAMMVLQDLKDSRVKEAMMDGMELWAPLAHKALKETVVTLELLEHQVLLVLQVKQV